ncbi:MAG TPA: hypothetical protein PKD86_16100 [Gemmatales bacterium]|nr:hypothetical protein [Gemmatales bacterium]
MTPNPGEMLGSLRNRLTRLQVRAERLEEERTAVRAEMQAQRSFLELAP